MPTPFDELDFEKRVTSGDLLHLTEQAGGMEGVISRTQEEGRDADRGQEVDRAGTGVIVIGTSETMNRTGEGVVEVPERERRSDGTRVRDARVTPDLGQCLDLEAAQKAPAVDPGQALIDMAGGSRQIEWTDAVAAFAGIDSRTSPSYLRDVSLTPATRGACGRSVSRAYDVIWSEFPRCGRIALAVHGRIAGAKTRVSAIRGVRSDSPVT
jgi:hypothetical protein